MRIVLAALLLSLAASLGAQAHARDDASERAADSFARATRSARGRLAADAGRLWGARLDTLEWLGVDGRTIYLSADPQRDGYERLAPGIWSGPLPDGLTPSNTSQEWAGRRWAMFVMPLPADTLDATRLLIHEGSHVTQPALLPLPRYSETGAGTDLLDRAAGRTWLRLEWRALAAALDGAGAGRTAATRDALVFRARRLLDAGEQERTRERALDVGEGLVEYTAWALTGGTPSAFASNIRSRAERTRSYVRGFPYFTGPAYAMLLDGARGGAWRRGLDERTDLSRMLAAATPSLAPGASAALGGDTASASTVRELAESAGARYGLATVRGEEESREAERVRRVAELTARFVTGPTLRLRPPSLYVSFDPNRQTSLGAAGTVMAGFHWRGDDGAELTADDGALVRGDWSDVRVPLDGVHLALGPLTAPLQLTGRGWALTLPAGWVVEAAEQGSVVVRPGKK